MSILLADLTALTMTAATTTTNAVDVGESCESIGIHSPATVTGTVTVQVEPSASGTTWRNLQSSGSDITITASECVVISPCPFRRIRLSTSSAPASDEVFTLIEKFQVR